MNFVVKILVRKLTLQFFTLRLCLVRSEIEMIEKKAKKIGFRVRLVGRVEKWEDGKYLGFPHVCFVGGMEK